MLLKMIEIHQPIVDDVLISSTGFVRVVDDVTITGEEFTMVIDRNSRELIVNDAVDLLSASSIINHSWFGSWFWVLMKSSHVKFDLHRLGNIASWILKNN